ncbi:MAG: glycosyltransferase family 4 protein [Bacteroidales bacterium]|jgi:glycosyltransferase involved in cell wall biosynthesis|nr:glycosyltransferase family 4 protein [Bacteroidales bacterium]
MKKIAFLMPYAGKRPVGGFKVVYEYANRLVKDNYDVSVIYPASLLFKERSLGIKLRSLIRFVYYILTGDYKCKSWFVLDNRVKEKIVWCLSERFVPKADIFICTAVETSEYLARYKNVPYSNKFYLIQHFEAWFFSEQRVNNSYHLPLRKIVIAEWLEDIVKSAGEDCTLIHNGFDFNFFTQTIPPSRKDKYRVAMLYHILEWKGCDDAFKALDLVKAKHPALCVNIFGFPRRPKTLPDWYDYYQMPDKSTLVRIYNESAIFISASHGEGFSLTPPEAMMCGLALAVTDIGGFTVVCKQDKTALLSPVHCPELLAANINKLIEDDALRIRLAETAHTFIQSFTWENAYQKFLMLIKDTK